MKHFYFSIFAIAFFCVNATAQCTTPVLTFVSTPETICSGESATLIAETDSGTVMWYDSQTDGTQLGTGDELESGILTQTTSFWAEGNNGLVAQPAISGGGKTQPSSTGGTSVVSGTSPWGLMFNATQSFILNSVDVFLTSANPGAIVIQLKDNSLNVLQTVTVNAPAGGTNANPVQFTVPLNLTITPGTGYRLVVVSNPPMIRDLGTNSFPYAIGSVGTITQGTINNANSNGGVYYFLYNWNFSPLVLCVSPRQEMVITVNVTDIPTGETNQVFVEGQTVADLVVAGQNLSWYADAAGNNPISTSTALVYGSTYYVSQTVDGCTSDMLAITVDDGLNTMNQALSNLKYFPNPVLHKLQISNGQNIDTIEIYNLRGQLIALHNTKSPTFELDFDGFKSGLYIVKISSGQAVKIFKVSKI